MFNITQSFTFEYLETVEIFDILVMFRNEIERAGLLIEFYLIKNIKKLMKL